MNKYLQLKIFAVSIIAFVVCASQQAKASHAMGADLTYECLGGNTYKIRVSFYRDCIGIPAPGSVYVNIKSPGCGQNLGITCNPIPGTGQEVTPMCPSANSTCNGGAFTGIQEWIYEGTVTLPMQCTDWTFSYSLCCRNAAITTITTPGSNTFYIYATLNNTVSPCNSSPSFTNKPVPFSCMGQQFQFNHGAVDPDGDSLVYSLVDPMQTATNPVNYITPYSATHPLNSIPALQFNTATGDITFNPQQLQVTVMAVLVQEYRNGVLIGSVIRDIQITVINCTNDLPTLTGINGTNNFDATICSNTPYCFNIFSNDINAGQQLNVTWNQGIDSATFAVAGSPHPTGTFCWTPKTSDISPTPHCFTARVNDDACPYLGSQTYSYCLTVIGIIPDAGPDQYIACSDLATISVNATGGTPPYSYQWSNGFTGQTQTVGVGTYIVTVSDGNCSATDTVSVISAFEPDAAFTWSGACAFSPIHFFDQSTTGGGILTNWYWNFGDGFSSTNQNPIHLYNSQGTYLVTLVVTNIYGCVDTIIQPVVVSPIPNASFTTGPACSGSTTCFNNTSIPPGNSWWNFGNGDTSNTSNPCITFDSTGTYTVTLISGDSLGCVDTVTQSITINPLPIANFIISGTTCQNGMVTFTSTSTDSTGFWWSFGDGDTSTVQNPIHLYTSSGTYIVTLVVFNQFGCSDTITHSVTIHPLPFANAGPDQTICLGTNATLTATGGTHYIWNPGGGTTGTISVSVSNNTSYSVIVTDANGCTAVDTVNIYVNPIPVATVSPDQSVCAGQSVILTAGGGTTYNWNPTGSTTSTITIIANGSTTYAVDVIDTNGCQATAFVNITVHQNPVITLQPAVFTCTGINAVLDPGNGGTNYQWSNGSTSQTISVNQQGTYTVTVTNQYGCSSTGSAQVSVGGQVVNNVNTVSICQGTSTTLNAGYPGNNYLWSDGSTTQTITVNSAGIYNVTITDANGCSGTVANTVLINVLPAADFTPNNVCINDPMLFHDISTINNGSITSWNWNFGDGNLSQQQNPQHIYQTTGTWMVTLIVTSNSGCSDTVTKNFSVYPLPTVNFTAANSCQHQTVQFTDQSSTTVGNLTGWNWNFGDGTYSSQQNPVHAYQNAGTYFVTLNVTTAGGCSDSLRKQVIVYPKPAANFTATQVCNRAPRTMTIRRS